MHRFQSNHWRKLLSCDNIYLFLLIMASMNHLLTIFIILSNTLVYGLYIQNFPYVFPQNKLIYWLRQRILWRNDAGILLFWEFTFILWYSSTELHDMAVSILPIIVLKFGKEGKPMAIILLFTMEKNWRILKYVSVHLTTDQLGW